MAGPDQEEGKAGSKMGSSSPKQHSTEVLQQRSKMPFCPTRMAIGGFAIALTLAHFTVYSKKKPEASALDVAKVATGTSHPDNTHTTPK